jgi:hypothetical protein
MTDRLRRQRSGRFAAAPVAEPAMGGSIAGRRRDSSCGSAAAMTRHYQDDPRCGAWTLPARHSPGYDSAMSINPTPSDAVAPLQPTLAWPGTDENCPKCHGERQVYYRRARQPGVEVFGGKRVTCPVSAGQGIVRAPLQSFGPAQPSDRR